MVVKLDSISVTTQGVHVMVKVTFDPQPWLFSAIDASPNLNTRLVL